LREETRTLENNSAKIWHASLYKTQLVLLVGFVSGHGSTLCRDEVREQTRASGSSRGLGLLRRRWNIETTPHPSPYPDDCIYQQPAERDWHQSYDSHIFPTGRKD
jgi:hypothetical protein